MSAASGATTLALVGWAWAVGVALADRRASINLADVAPELDGPLVSAIVPARNEAGRIGPALRSLSAQRYRALEVIVVDDESQDETAAQAAAVARTCERIRLVPGLPPPPGWIGKNWAVHEGVERARGTWLLFTDADVLHAPDALARAVPLARELGRGGVTILARWLSGSAPERIVQPAALALIRAFVVPGPLVRSQRFGLARANGAFILLERGLYERTGGHAALRRALVDDYALARVVKAAGGLLVVVEGYEYVSVRMYDGLAELWHGWRKNSSAGVAGGSLSLAFVLAFAGTAIALAPALAVVRGPRRLGVAALALQLAVRAAVANAAPTPRRYWATFPLGALFLSVTSLVSSGDRLRGVVEWRGRCYSREGTRRSPA